MLDLAVMSIACLAILLRFDMSAFLTWIGIGVILGAFCWYACSSFSLLWNTKFKLTWYHHALCVLAAACTFLTVILFSGLTHVEKATAQSLDSWEASAKSAIGGEQSIRQVADDAFRYFSARVPHLTGALAELAAIEGGTATAESQSELNLVSKVRNIVEQRVNSAVFRGKVILATFFLFAQTVSFGVIGYAAFKDIQVRI